MDPKTYLTSLGISYKSISHPLVFTCEEAEKLKSNFKCPGLKNLFLKTKTSPLKYFLVILPSSKKLDLKILEKNLNYKLTFANGTELKNLLGLTQGAVSPFGLLNDKKNVVKVLIDSEVLNQEFVSFHPNINTETLEISTKDFLKFLSSLKVDYSKF